MSAGLEYRMYPNPFTSFGTIEFMRVDKTDHTVVEVYTMAGTKIATLFDGIAEQGMLYKVPFDGVNQPDGMYIYKISSGDRREVINGRMSLTK